MKVIPLTFIYQSSCYFKFLGKTFAVVEGMSYEN
jgi:hypothetical protein